MNKTNPTANTREIPHFLASARHVRAHDCLDFVVLRFGGIPVAKLYMAREEDIWDFVVDKVGAYLVYEHDYSYYAYDEAEAIKKVCERPLNNLLRAITGKKLNKEEAPEIVDSFRRKYGSAKGDWYRYFDMILEESGLSGKFKWEVYPEGLPDLASLMEGKLVIDGRLIAEVG